MHDPNKTQLGSPVADPNRTQMGSPQMVDPNRTMMGTAPSLNVTQTIKPVQCPVCKAFNPPGTAWCIDCGLIFEMALDGDAFGAPAVQMPVLVENSGREHQLRPGSNVLGRQGDIILDDTRCSRRHAEVTVTPEGITVQDLGSTNGTLVNGQRLNVNESRLISNSDKVSLGGLELTLSLPGEGNKTIGVMSGKTSAMTAAPTTNTSVATLVLPTGDKPLEVGTYSFGRRDGNDIVINDPYVSGKHGQFDVTETAVFLTDTGSTNGTVLNDAKLNPGQKVQLTATDVIKLGTVELTVRFKNS